MVRVAGVEISPFLLFLILLNVYFLLLYILVRKGWLQRLGMSLFGPALMIKTERGRGLLDWFARARRLFDGAAAVGIVLTAAVMALMSLVLILQLFVIFRIPPEQAPSARLILGIPGVNPIIPVGYGILALIFAVVVHELSHGILARVHNIRVKTMGLLFLVIPIGAFVEPDEDELRAAPRRHRVKVFGAGPTSNLFFAAVFALLFSPLLMASASPVVGAPLLTVEKVTPQTPSPACAAGLLPGWVVTRVSGHPSGANPVDVPDREMLARILNQTPPGHVLYVTVREPRVPEGLEDRTCVNETNLRRGLFPVQTAACIEQYSAEACRAAGNATGHPDPLNRTVIGVSLYPVDAYHELLSNPLSSTRGFLFYVSLPFLALQGQFPLAGAFQDFYTTPFDAGLFWPLANALYWFFWINLMLGLTNALPIVPLDGGHMFRDFVGAGLGRVAPSMTEARRDAVVRRVSLVVALFLLALVILQFVGPRLAGLFR